MASNSALGLYADGLDVKVAHVSRKGNKVVLVDLYGAKLTQKLEVASAVAGTGFEAPAETIDLTQPNLEEQQEGESNSAVITEVFSRYGKQKKRLAIGIGEPSVFYHPIEVTGKQKRDKIISRIVDELQATRSGISKDQVELLSTNSETGYVGIVRENDIPILDLVSSARPFLGSRMPRISFVESSDVALVNLVRNNYSLKSDETTVVVYVGVEYTRLIFMRGKMLFNIAPIISEGADSFSVQNTIYSRILLGQDNLSLPRIDKVILCGECKNFDIKGFLSSLLVGAEVDYLQLARVDTSSLPEGGIDLIPQYAVAISSAIRAVAGKSKNFYISDLTPDRIRESQKIFKLAWHGLVLAIVVFASTFYFTYHYAENKSEILKIGSEVASKQVQAAQIGALKSQISQVQSQFAKYSTAVSLLESLTPNTERWSTLMTSLSNTARRVGNLWILNVHEINEDTYFVEGLSIFRDRIPPFAESYPGSILRKVSLAEIRGKTVYDFQIDLRFPTASKSQKPSARR